MVIGTEQSLHRHNDVIHFIPVDICYYGWDHDSFLLVFVEKFGLQNVMQMLCNTIHKNEIASFLFHLTRSL